MKKSYMVGLVLILLFAVSMIAYGAWLNQTGENAIADRMQNRTIPLQGAKAAVRDFYPRIEMETINLYSEEMADAVALIDGRIESVYVSKNASVRRGQVIFSLVNDDIPLKIQQAESSIAKAEAQLANAKNNYARYTRLMERDERPKKNSTRQKRLFLRRKLP